MASTTSPVYRVLYVESNEDHTVGGSYQALFDLVRGLDRQRFEPVVLFYQDNVFADRLRALGAEVIVFDRERAIERATYGAGPWWRRAAARVAAVRRRARLLADRRIDLVHLNDSPLMGHTTWLPAARLRRVRCVVTSMARVTETPTGVTGWLAHRFDQIIPISRAVRDTLVDAGFADHKLTTVYLGIDPEELRAQVGRSRQEVRAELGVPEHRVLAAMVGNLRKWKGQHVVLEALAQLPGSVRESLHVLFIGAASPNDDAYVTRLHQQVADEGLQDSVTFLGSRDDVPDLLNAADLAIHASVTPEPFGLVVPEAMALGKAVIAAATGGPAEVVTPESGLLFDPERPEELAAHLEALVGDAARRDQYGRAAVQRAEEFTVSRMTAGNQDVYERVLGAKGHTTSGRMAEAAAAP